MAFAVGVLPAKAHSFHGGTCGLATHEAWVSCTVHLAKGVSAGHQGNGFFVVHGHAAKGFAHVACRGKRIGVAVRAFRIDINQAHLYGSERILEVAVAFVALVTEHFGFWTPVNILFRLPEVGASASKSKGLEAHGFEGHIADQNKEVGPRELFAVLLLDGPKQHSRFVEVAVVGPAVQGGKTMRTRSGSAPSVCDAVGSGGVPGEPNKEGTVVSVVGGPPFLRVGHKYR